MTTGQTQHTTWGEGIVLDLFSTSATNSHKCIKNAPYICVPPNGRDGLLMQACCNDWTCPRCGQMRARYEYGRIVEGCRKLAEHGNKLYFITITCRGDISSEQAEANYLAQTHKLHAAFQQQVKRAGGHWAYCAVTERQKRGHPHSHYIMACKPTDAFLVVDDYQRYGREVAELNAYLTENELGMEFSPAPLGDFGFTDLFSLWLARQCAKIGLGVQARVSLVETAEGVSRYVAKYLFKESVSTRWPKGWKRVRYTQNWPKMPEKEGSTAAYPVITYEDWKRVAAEAGTIVAKDAEVYDAAMRRLCLNVVCKVDNPIDLPKPRKSKIKRTG